jgi:hypothetical protein
MSSTSASQSSESCYNPKIARRVTRSSDEPYLYDVYFKDQSEKMSKKDCLKLAQNTADMTKLPVSCQKIMEEHHQMVKAWDGAPVSERSRGALAKESGKLPHHQLQRTITRHQQN